MPSPPATDAPRRSYRAVVGIGASAGGLAALEAFFTALPPGDSGLAFVVVQHLSPDCKSILGELIQRRTCLAVFEAADLMPVQANCVYIIPPNSDLALQQGTLQVLEPSDPRGQRSPINFFFRSLAQDQRERAIGIVLSGTGSDGALGVRAIKGEGGLVMAQEPKSAEYDGMPLSAIATGQVDYVQLPAEMPAQLLAYVGRAFTAGAQIQAPGIPDEVLRKIVLRLHGQTGHDFSLYKQDNLARRIARRMAVVQVDRGEDYLGYLEQSWSEGEALFRDLLIGVTRFFRDPMAFQALQEKVIPRIFADRPPGAPIRVWVPGCSTGEEAYSIAILLQEHADSLQQNCKAQIFATDIDRQAIDHARSGLYPASIAADISPPRLARHFTPLEEGGPYTVHKRIREMLIFSEHNVISDPPFGRLHLISFRNVLIYLDVELHKKLFAIFNYALHPGGYLFLGSAESLGECGSLFHPLDRKEKIYQRSGDGRPGRLPLGRHHPYRLTELTDRPPRASTAKRSHTFRELTERALLQEYAAAAILVDKYGEILYLHGRTGSYLEPAPGEAGLNVLKMAREGLRRPLTGALNQAVAHSQKIDLGALRVRSNGGHVAVNVSVRPVPAQSEPFLYLIIMMAQEEGGATGFPPVPVEMAVPELDRRVIALQEELRVQQEQLQAAYEELEISNQDLQSANEEMQSINEELQSANEELQTSQEELQSINEELSTVNSELQSKVADLSQANNDMNNLLAGTGVGTVFVDHKLKIVRFTPAVTQVINLIPGDVGRPVADIVPNLVGYDRLVADVEQVLDTLASRDVEVETRTGNWFLLRIRPYRTLENVIEGAVITFVDITEMRKVQEDLTAREQWLRQLANTLPLLVWTCGAEGQCDYLGPQWYAYTGQSPTAHPEADWAGRLPEPERAKILVVWGEGIRAGQTFTAEFPIAAQDGIYHQFRSWAVPLRDAAGMLTRWFVTSSKLDPGG
ncbi:PAS domain-containing protein [bacterium]|nr:PAS domain-containing protein [bacterium]